MLTRSVSVLLTGAVVLSSVLFTASCSGTGKNASERDEVWSHIETGRSVASSYHSLRNNSYTGTDSNGNLLVTGIVQKSVSVLDAQDGSLKGTITVDTYETSMISDGWIDTFAYVVNGRSYLEINEIPDDYYTGAARISSSYYALDTDDMSVIGRQRLLDAQGMVTTGCWSTSAGTCLVETDDPWLMSVGIGGRSGIDLYYFKDDYEPDEIPIERFLSDTIADIRFVVSLDTEDLIVSCMMLNNDIKTVRVGFSGEMITVSEDTVPDYLKGEVTAYNSDDGLYVRDMRGAYLVPSSDTELDSPSYEKLVDWSRCDAAMTDMSSMVPYDVGESGEVRLIGYTDQMLTDETCQAYTATATRCEFPYGERQAITIGCIDYIPEVIAGNIDSFNSSSEDTYLRAVLISSDGLEPVVPISQEDMPFDMSYEQKESLKLHAYKDYLTGEDVPDIVITDGMHAQFQSPELFADLKRYMDQGVGGFNRDDYMCNVFELSQVGNSVYTIPLYYYVYGLVEFSMTDLMSFDSRMPRIVSIDFDEYEADVISRWDGDDPLSDFMGRELCFEEMLSTQYAELVDMETGTALFEGDAFSSILEYTSSLESKDDIVYYYTFGSGSDIYVEYASLCYSSDVAIDSMYLNSCTWMGLPTEDGNTPSLGVALAAGVTNRSEHKDAAWDVVMYLLSADAQRGGKDYFGLPINKEVARSDFASPDYAFDFVEELTGSAMRMYYFDCDLAAISSETINAYADGEMGASEAGEYLGAHILLS